MSDEEKMVMYLRRVNRGERLGARSHAAGVAVGRHLFWAVVAAVIVGAVLSLATCAQAQGESSACTVTGDHTAPRRATLVHEGESGWWFRGDIARCLLGDVRELQVLRGDFGLLRERLALRDDQLRAVREANALGMTAEARATGALEAAVRGRREAEEARDSWVRSPLLWFVVGVAAAVVVAVGAVLLLRAIQTP